MSPDFTERVTGQPARVGTEGPGVSFVSKGAIGVAKATGNGFYTTTDEAGRVHRFKVQKGDVLPDGAEFVAGESDDADEAPAKEQQAKRGPSETAEAKGAKETG